MHRRQILHCNATNFVLLLLVTESFLQVYVFHYYDSFILQTLQFSSNKYLCLLGDSLAVSISFVLLLLVTESFLQAFHCITAAELRDRCSTWRFSTTAPGDLLQLVHLDANTRLLTCKKDIISALKPKPSYSYG